MMIGGNDIIYPRRLSSDMLGFVLRTIENRWPRAVLWVDGEYTRDHKMTIQDAITNTVGAPGELLIYADEDAWTSWDRDGANGENGDSLLHILLGENTTTFVVHHEGGVTQPMVADIQNGLDRLYPPKEKDMSEKQNYPAVDDFPTHELILAVVRYGTSISMEPRLEEWMQGVYAEINKRIPPRRPLEWVVGRGGNIP